MMVFSQRGSNVVYTICFQIPTKPAGENRCSILVYCFSALLACCSRYHMTNDECFSNMDYIKENVDGRNGDYLEALENLIVDEKANFKQVYDQAPISHDQDDHPINTEIIPKSEDDSPESSHQCKVCLKFYSSKKSLKHHLRLHDPNRQPKVPKTEGEIERPHQCQVCLKCYTAKESLRRHMRTHDPSRQELTHFCSQCPKSFREKDHLSLHVTRIHGEKRFECQYCSAAFRAKTSLERHRLVHSEKREMFQCDVCFKSFSVERNLTAHKRIHDENNPYKCDECGRQCRHSTELRIHKASHAGERNHECDICQQKFRSAENL